MKKGIPLEGSRRHAKALGDEVVIINWKRFPRHYFHLKRSSSPSTERNSNIALKSTLILESTKRDTRINRRRSFSPRWVNWWANIEAKAVAMCDRDFVEPKLFNRKTIAFGDVLFKCQTVEVLSWLMEKYSFSIPSKPLHSHRRSTFWKRDRDYEKHSQLHSIAAKRRLTM